MFSKQHLGVIDWWIFYILMAIPVVNIVVFVLIILSSKSNKSLKSFLWASLLPLIIVIVHFGTGVLASLIGS